MVRCIDWRWRLVASMLEARLVYAARGNGRLTWEEWVASTYNMPGIGHHA